MTDRDAFLRAIRGRPTDPLPRLVYADWLDENAGDESCWLCKGTGLADIDDLILKGQRCFRCSGSGRSGNNLAIDAALQRVLAEPDEDKHRMAYADAVQPSDPERAEFVRVQCRLAVLNILQDGNSGFSNPVVLAEIAALRMREEQLHRRHWERWRVLGPIKIGWPHACDFRRGFIEMIRCEAADFFRHAEAITDATPLREVRLTTMPELDEFEQEGGDDGRAVVTSYQFVGQPRKATSQLPILRGGLMTGGRVPTVLAFEWPRIKFTLSSSIVSQVAARRDAAIRDMTVILERRLYGQPLSLAGAVGGVAERPDGH